MNPKFLIVDDEPHSRELVRELLVQHFPGSSVLTTINGSDGMAVARAENPDVMILDAKLPKMSGFDVCARIKNDPATADILVIMYTGYFGDACYRAIGMKCGADGYLCKPFEDAEMVFQVRVLLRLTRMIRELREAKAAVQVANDAKSTLIAGMSHELRTPLNSVIGFSQVLRDEYFGPLNERQKEYLNHVLSSGQTLLGLIDNVLDIAHITTLPQPGEYSRIQLAQLLDDAMDRVKHQCVKRGIALEKRMDADIRDLQINSNPHKLRQILFLLLANALKFSSDNGRIVLSACRTEPANTGVGSLPNVTAVAISVSDEGIGIAPEHIHLIFEDFFQSCNNRNQKTPGLGLGLALARRLVVALGGQIWAESAGAGQGSRFTFAVPLVT